MAEGSLTFEEFCKLSSEERCKRYDELSDHDKFRARISQPPSVYGTVMCNSCIYNNRDFTCKAYPNGIPRELILRREHDTPFPGDNGIRYKAKD